MRKARGRFDILAAFDDDSYVRFTSDKTRSLPAAEIVACLRKYAQWIENGLTAQQRKTPAQERQRVIDTARQRKQRKRAVDT